MAGRQLSQSQKRRQFWWAFAATWAVNLVVGGAIAGLAYIAGGNIAGVIALVGFGLQTLANIAAPIVLAFTWRMMALGWVTAMGSLFALAVVEGVFFTAGDFVGAAVNNATPNGVPTVGFVFLGFGVLAWLSGAVLILRGIHRSIK